MITERIYRWSRKRMIKRLNGDPSRLTDLKRKHNLVITQHAYVRYIERVLGLDLDEIRRELVTVDLIDRVNKLGDGKYRVGKARVTVIGKTIVTVDKNFLPKLLPVKHVNKIRGF